MLLHFSPKTPVSSASFRGDAGGLHTMRKATLQRVWLREAHYLTQSFQLRRKICERSCQATGRSNLAQEKSWAGLRSTVANRTKNGGGGGGGEEKEERYWKISGESGVEAWEKKWKEGRSCQEMRRKRRRRRRRRAICLRE